jgi:hypothetical protein
VDRARLDLLARTYGELGQPPDRAAARARVAYAAILGLSHLAQSDDLDPAEPALLAEEAVAVFLPSGDGGSLQFHHHGG